METTRISVKAETPRPTDSCRASSTRKGRERLTRATLAVEHTVRAYGKRNRKRQAERSKDLHDSPNAQNLSPLKA
jgi:tyrosyl-tRNA synthetase